MPRTDMKRAQEQDQMVEATTAATVQDQTPAECEPDPEDRLISLRDLKEYLRDNLQMDVRLSDSNDYGYGGSDRFEVRVTLQLEGERIAESSDSYRVHFPSRD